MQSPSVDLEKLQRSERAVLPRSKMTVDIGKSLSRDGRDRRFNMGQQTGPASTSFSKK